MEGTVYLEDVEPAHVPASESSESTAVSATPKPKTKPNPPVAGAVKRQRTLADMFSGSQGKASSEPSAKKLKLSASTNSITAGATLKAAGSASRPKGFGVQKLNSIPFSLSAFQESLSNENKEYLKLECEVLGKSW
jgi:uracil-DNA glycosylase